MRYKNPKARKSVSFHKNSNVKHVLLNKVFQGDKDALIKWVVENTIIYMYNGEVGQITVSANTKFDLSGWQDEVSDRRLKAARHYVYSRDS